DRPLGVASSRSGGGSCVVGVADAVGSEAGIPPLTGGDDGVQLAQDGRGDHGLGLGRGEPVVLAAGQVLVAGGVDGVGALGAPDRAPGGQAEPGPALAGELGAADVGAG